MNEINQFRKQILSTFKLNGYTIRSGLSDFLAQHLIPLSKNDQSKLLSFVIDHIQKQNLSNPNIELKHIEDAIKDCDKTGLEESETIFSVINAFDIPKFIYDHESKKFLIKTKGKRLLSHPEAKSAYFRERYDLLWQRTNRHEMFIPRTVLFEKNVKKFTLRRVEHLLSISKMNDVVIMGLLTQIQEGKFHLEDPTGAILLDLKEANLHSGLFCEGCFVLVQGKYSDGILKVSSIGFPPPENANSSRAYFGTNNTWGGRSKILLKHSKRLSNIESTDMNATIIFLSDCWLDDPVVMEKLKILFEGYNDCPPTAIILMGPFTKHPEHYNSLRQRFIALTDVIYKFNQIVNKTDIVLVPDARDPIASNVIPRPSLPDSMFVNLKKLLPRLILATNPCRLQYCTQQIVVFRADLTTKMCRNVIKFPEIDKIEENIARTLICQGTLAPLQTIAMPIHWDYDAVLSLYPLPDLIVIGDVSKSFDIEQQGCIILNTGSFPKSNFSFKVYVPHNKTVEDSLIPESNI